MRFHRTSSQLIGSRLYGRLDLNYRLDASTAMDRGAFLGKLWGLFGKPSPRIGGFEYVFRDTKTGLSFIAYAGPHGPCYGGELANRKALKPVLEDFEALIDPARPVPCAIEYIAEQQFGGGTWVLGCRDGRSFDLPDRRGRKGSARVERRRLSA